MGKTAKGNIMYSEPVSISSFNQGKAKQIFEEVNAEGAKAVLKNNKRIGVIVSPSKYDEMIERLEDYELLIEATERIRTNKKSVSMNDVMNRYGISREDLDNTNVEIDI